MIGRRGRDVGGGKKMAGGGEGELRIGGGEGEKRGEGDRGGVIVRRGRENVDVGIEGEGEEAEGKEERKQERGGSTVEILLK